MCNDLSVGCLLEHKGTGALATIVHIEGDIVTLGDRGLGGQWTREKELVKKRYNVVRQEDPVMFALNLALGYVVSVETHFPEAHKQCDGVLSTKKTLEGIVLTLKGGK